MAILLFEESLMQSTHVTFIRTQAPILFIQNRLFYNNLLKTEKLLSHYNVTKLILLPNFFNDLNWKEIIDLVIWRWSLTKA